MTCTNTIVICQTRNLNNSISPVRHGSTPTEKRRRRVKIYLSKAFDIDTFKIFTPEPAGFTTEEAAKVFIDARNAEQSNVFYAFDEVDISEMSAEELRRANENSEQG